MSSTTPAPPRALLIPESSLNASEAAGIAWGHYQEFEADRSVVVAEAAVACRLVDRKREELDLEKNEEFTVWCREAATSWLAVAEAEGGMAFLVEEVTPEIMLACRSQSSATLGFIHTNAESVVAEIDKQSPDHPFPRHLGNDRLTRLRVSTLKTVSGCWLLINIAHALSPDPPSFSNWIKEQSRLVGQELVDQMASLDQDRLWLEWAFTGDDEE